MEKDTLHFILKYTLSNIITKIIQQKIDFIKKYGYEPEYIELDDDLYWFLSKQKEINLKNDDKLETIYGMKIKRDVEGNL